MSWNGVFMAEIQKHECLYNKFSREYRNKELRNDCWQKVAEKFDLTPMAAEKKFRNIRTAYGRWLRKRRSNPPKNGQDFIPFAFENCEWLGMHIIHRDSTLSNDTTCIKAIDSGSDDDGSPVTMSNIEFLNFADYNDYISPSSHHSNNNVSSQHEATTVVETIPHDHREIQTTQSNEAVNNTTTNYSESNGGESNKKITSYDKGNAIENETSSNSLRRAPNERQLNNSVMVPHGIKRRYSEYEDEDELYCRSLVPRLKRLTPQAKAYVRIQLEQLLYHAEYSNDMPQIQPFSFHSNENTKATSLLNGRGIEQA